MARAALEEERDDLKGQLGEVLARTLELQVEAETARLQEAAEVSSASEKMRAAADLAREEAKQLADRNDRAMAELEAQLRQLLAEQRATFEEDSRSKVWCGREAFHKACGKGGGKGAGVGGTAIGGDPARTAAARLLAARHAARPRTRVDALYPPLWQVEELKRLNEDKENEIRRSKAAKEKLAAEAVERLKAPESVAHVTKVTYPAYVTHGTCDSHVTRATCVTCVPYGCRRSRGARRWSATSWAWR